MQYIQFWWVQYNNNKLQTINRNEFFSKLFHVKQFSAEEAQSKSLHSYQK